MHEDTLKQPFYSTLITPNLVLCQEIWQSASLLVLTLVLHIFNTREHWPNDLLKDDVPRAWSKNVLEKLAKLVTAVTNSPNTGVDELVQWLSLNCEEHGGFNSAVLTATDNWLSNKSRTRNSSRAPNANYKRPRYERQTESSRAAREPPGNTVVLQVQSRAAPPGLNLSLTTIFQPSKKPAPTYLLLCRPSWPTAALEQIDELLDDAMVNDTLLPDDHVCVVANCGAATIAVISDQKAAAKAVTEAKANLAKADEIPTRAGARS
ncbi:hypothetical protein BKA59DRAFT_517240 [Fusarium tricinctum]|uniref:Uncharacterized protein n=1 Tax=Fusarium tricinctum TaxID=61284 RepID=A0A8K0RK59_9HYPO|nr:hypothetical protein BKA59DRAFT_517240 [Fusarium tricinctum]